MGMGRAVGNRIYPLGSKALADADAAEAKVDLGTGVRKFETGATRDVDETKLDYDGFLSARVLERYGEYMHQHRKVVGQQTLRASDNWQKGIPLSVYMSSAWRHFFDWWKESRGLMSREGCENAICGLLFNACGYLHEVLKKRGYGEHQDAQ